MARYWYKNLTFAFQQEKMVKLKSIVENVLKQKLITPKRFQK